MNLALLAAAATGVQIGATIVASRAVIGEVPPLTLALLRYGIALLCLAPWILKALRPLTHTPQAQAAIKFKNSDILAIAALGIGQFAVLVLLLNLGLQRIGAAQTALVFSLFPLLTLFLSALCGRERVTPALLFGVLLSVAGVALALTPKLTGTSTTSHGDWWGEAAVLASTLIGAACSVLYRPYLQRYPTLPLSGISMLAAVLSLLLMAGVSSGLAPLAHMSAQAWYIVIAIGVFSAMAYLWWLYALKHESPTRVTVFLALNPVTAGLCGHWFLNEPFTSTALAAMALIACGLWLATHAPTLQSQAQT
ncbi:DMT family transporter [Variovorax sp. HJSM1_2]|uniref:DMT family transporter n=1 Tax=Variovorax sp. HJSM1_2 TaxID=3366263 RepID=UPI003BB9D62D